MIRVASNSSHYGRDDALGITAVIGSFGLVGWLAAASVLALAARVRVSNLANRLTVYAGLLAFLYPLAAFNRFVWLRPGEACAVSVSLVSLNTVVWVTALVEVVAYYLRYDGAPTHWTSYDTLTTAIRVLVVAMAGASLADESTRFVAVILVVPLAAVLALAATREAGEARAIHLGAPPRSWRTFSRPRRVFAILGAVGLFAFVAEILSPALTCALSIGVSSLFMLFEHVALGVLLAYIAYWGSDAEPTVMATPVPPASSSLLAQDDVVVIAADPPTLEGQLVDWSGA